MTDADWHRTSLRVEPTPEGNVLLSTSRAQVAMTREQARGLMRALLGALRAAKPAEDDGK